MSADADCIFCKIVAGEVPCERIAEDDDALAFMDINPVVRGHVLVIPKSHHRDLLDTPADLLGRCMAMAQTVAAAQMNGLDAEGFNLFQCNGECSGQVVFHTHFHVIPRWTDDNVRYSWSRAEYGEGEMPAAAAKIREAL